MALVPCISTRLFLAVWCVLCTGGVPAFAISVSTTTPVHRTVALPAGRPSGSAVLSHPGFFPVTVLAGADAAARQAGAAFETRTSSGRMILRDAGLSYVFTVHDGEPRTRSDAPTGHLRTSPPPPAPGVRLHRADVEFMGVRPGLRAEGGEPGSPRMQRIDESGATSASAFHSVRYRHAWPGVDLIFRTGTDGVKMDAEFAPYADRNGPRFRYRGFDTLMLHTDGSLEARTSLGTLREDAPVAFYSDGAGEAVDVRFVLDGADVCFALGPHDPSRPVTVDPGIVWSTFLGSGDADWGHSVASDAAGNVYVAGATLSAGFPSLAGMQMAHAGDWDAFLVKYAPNGVMLWATFLGGAQEDYSRSVSVDAGGTVTIAGWTASDGFPTLNAMQPARAGGLDAFVAQFSSTGLLRWSTFLGGTMDEKCMGVASDAAGNVAVTGWTFSTDYPTQSPHQSIPAGYSDVFVASFTSTGVLRWSTYLGGGADDEAFSIASGPSGVVAIGGRTGSSNFPTRSASQSLPGGGGDAFAALFSSGGVLQWSTFLGGTDADFGTGIAVDPSGAVACVGYTRSDDFPVSNAWKPVKSRLTDAFVTRYSSSGSVLWSTYFGGFGSDAAAGVAVTTTGSILFTGNTGSIDLPLRNAHQSSLTGDESFVARFTASGDLAWSTYHGGSTNEGGAGITTAPGGDVFVIGSTNSPDFPTRAAQQSTHGGGAWDAFVTRLGECVVPATAIARGPTRICPGGSVTLEANADTLLTYQWLYRGFPISGETGRTYVARDSGVFAVEVRNANDCVSVSPPITVMMSAPRAIAGPPKIICPGGAARLEGQLFDGTPPHVIRWSPASTLSDSTILDPVARPDSSATYLLTVRDALGCVSIDSVRVIVDKVTVVATGDTTVCQGGTAQLNARALTGRGPFSWDWQPTEGLNNPIAPNPVAAPSRTTTYVVHIKNALGCEAFDTVTVTVRSVELRVSGTVSICPGDSARLSVTPLSGTPPFRYSWVPLTEITGENTPSPTVRPRSTTTYAVTVTDANGCSGSATVTVFVLPEVRPGITASATPLLCDGDSVILTAGEGFRSWRWNTGETTRSIVVRRDGSYACAVTTEEGCHGIDSIRVRVMPFPRPVILRSGVGPLCDGDSVILDAGEGFQSYLWSSGERTRFLTVTRSGTWWVRVENEAGCAGGSDTVRVRVLPRPEPVVSGPRAVCAREPAWYAVAAAAGVRHRWSVTGGIAVSATDEDSVSVQWGSAGDGSITVLATVDSSGCERRIIIPVRIDEALEPRIQPSGVLRLCPGARRTLDAGPGYDWYRWSTGETTREIEISAPGRYRVRVGRGTACEGGDSVDVVNVPVPVPRITAPRMTLCGVDSIILSVEDYYAAYLWSTGDTSRVLRIRTAGSYTVTVTDSGGCSGMSAPLIIAQAPVPMARVSGDSIVCSAGEYAYVLTGDSVVVERWYAAGGSIVRIPSDSTAVVRWDAPGSGELRVDFRHQTTGCEGSVTIPVMVHDGIPPRISASTATPCTGDTVTVTAEAGYTEYRWSDGVVGPVRTLTTDGRLTVAAVTPEGCPVVSDTLVVQFSPGPVIALEGPVTVCIGSEATYRSGTMEGPPQWTVSGGRVLQAGGDSARVLWEGSGTGVVSVRVRSAAGCQSDATMQVAVGTTLQPVIRISGPVPACTGDTVVLDAGAGYARYEWSDGSRARVIRVHTAGSYSVRVHDNAGCTGESLPADVTFLPRPLPVIAGPGVLCAGDTITLATAEPYPSYRWSTGDTTRTIRVHADGVYAVSVLAMNGCTGISDTHRVTVRPLPPKPVVSESGGTLRTTASGTLQWYENDLPIPGAMDATLRPVRAGWYRVRTTDAFGCSAISDGVFIRDTVQITAELSLPMLSAAPGDIVDIPIVLRAEQSLLTGGEVRVRGVLRVRADVAVPLPGDPSGRITGGDRLLPFTGHATGVDRPIATLRVLLTLGGSDRTPLRIDSLEWDGLVVENRTTDGEIRLDICREGGDRMFDATPRLSLSQNRPNPFNAETRIAWSLIEPGAMRLVVSDMLGREVSVLYDGVAAAGPGETMFDGTRLASGVYVCTLVTAHARRSILMLVEK